jgi:hypothetical protein
MFSERFGLEQAVLAGTKTMTRRIIPIDLYNQTDWKAVVEGDFEAVVDGEGYYHDIRNCGKYHIGEEVAIAQPYKNDDVLTYNAYNEDGTAREDGLQRHKEMLDSKGYRNKMFVKAEYMPHRIRITEIKVERLQDISEEDCLREGIKKMEEGVPYRFDENGKIHLSADPRMLFADLIDRISGRGTWQSNPWVYVYTFELIK